MLLIPVSQWLLCIWQAREARAPWWAVLLTFVCVQLSKLLLERKKTQDGKGWPDLLRASVDITLAVYTVQRILIDIEPSGRITGVGLMAMVIAGMMDYDLRTTASLLKISFSLTAVAALLWREWGAPLDHDKKKHVFLWREWLQFLLSLHALLVGHVAEARETYMRQLCILTVSVLASRSERSAAEGRFIVFLLLFPALCWKQQWAISAGITPILDQICLPELYPIADIKKAEARRILIAQQKQEILVYIMAWCVTLGLWAQLRPTEVLPVLQVLGALLYLASLSRSSTVIHFFRSQTPRIKADPVAACHANEVVMMPHRRTGIEPASSTAQQRIATATIAATPPLTGAHAKIMLSRDSLNRMMTQRSGPPSSSMC